MLTTLAVALVLTGAPKTDPKLVGSWMAGNVRFVTFNANGTGELDEGAITWSADGQTITVKDDEGSTDQVAYQLRGDSLTVSMGAVPLTLTRGPQSPAAQKKGKLEAKLEKARQGSEDDDEEEAEAEAMAEARAFLERAGPAGAAGPAKAGPAGQAAPKRAAGGDQLSRLLMSSAWCSFKYSQITGASSSTRVRFLTNGSWSTSSRGETYTSGAAGSVAGQYDSGGDGQWSVKQNTLWMSFPPEQPQLQPVQGFSVTQNSNGYPILRGEGMEWSRCN